MNITFENKVALVTGAASGLGFATAKAFAEAGASVVLAEWSEKEVQVAAKRTGSPHDSGSATNMIRVAVSEDQVLELVWGTAKPADRPEDCCLLIRGTSVDQCQPVVALDQACNWVVGGRHGAANRLEMKPPHWFIG
jgi:NAD(P)-dependent dehydrogenase (short-subunit alcohol dehydrogenase family)